MFLILFLFLSVPVLSCLMSFAMSCHVGLSNEHLTKRNTSFSLCFSVRRAKPSPRAKARWHPVASLGSLTPLGANELRGKHMQKIAKIREIILYNIVTSFHAGCLPAVSCFFSSSGKCILDISLYHFISIPLISFNFL